MALSTRDQRAHGQQRPSLVEPDTEIAKRHFDKGTAFYSAGKYAEAIAEFEAAKEVKPLPAFDYNVARCHDRLEHSAEAADAYERYLATLRPGKEAEDVRARIAVLRARVPVPPPTEAHPPLDAVGASPPTSSPVTIAIARPAAPATARPPGQVAAWVAGGAGAAVLLGSLSAGIVAHDRYSSLDGRCTSDGVCDHMTVPDARNTIAVGRDAAIASDVLLGVGLAGVVTGVVLYLVEGRLPTEGHAWRLAPMMETGGTGVSFAVVR